jgi:hypothetical protein
VTVGNVKLYTFTCPLHPGEEVLALQEVVEAARSSLAIVQAVDDGSGGRAVMGMVESSSQVADRVIDLVRERYPGRWCVFTRFDSDYADFRVISWEDPRDLVGDNGPDVRIADNWYKP